jgi:hypothetical protein
MKCFRIEVHVMFHWTLNMYIQRGHHLFYFKCADGILSRSMYAATFRRQLLQQHQEFCSLDRWCWPLEFCDPALYITAYKKSQDVMSGELVSQGLSLSRPMEVAYKQAPMGWCSILLKTSWAEVRLAVNRRSSQACPDILWMLLSPH